MAEPPVPDLSAVTSPPPLPLSYEDIQVSEEPIGAGGQAVVYEATVSGSDTPSRVALKEPLNQGTLTSGAIESFLKEAETWQTIDRREREEPRWTDYQHIVGVIDTGQAGIPWIAMEYMDGGDLDDRLTDAPDGLPVAEALWIGECLCRGLEIASEYGFSHLDVKPKNVLFRQTPNGTWDVPKLADWGVARVLAEETGTMNEKSVEYAAPEQFDPSEFGDPDSLTDLYQVGAVVYAMLTGEPPYTGSSTQIMREVVLGDGPDPPSRLRSELSEAIDVAVTTAMAQQKTDRYRSLQDFERTLRAIRTDGSLPTVVSQQIESPAVAYISESNKKENSTDGTVSSASADPARVESWPSFQGDRTQIGHRPTVSAPDPPVKADWHFETGAGIYSSPAVVDDTVFFGSDDGNLYTVDAATGEEKWHFETGDWIKSSPAVANGTVFVGSDSGVLHAVNAATGEERWHFKVGDWIRSSPAVADGAVFVGSEDDNLYAVDAATGEKRWQFETRGQIESSPAVDDGTVFVGSYDGNLYAVDAANGGEIWQFETKGRIGSSPAVADGTVFVGSYDGNLYAADAANGEEIWQFETKGSIESSPAVANGTVFVGDRDQNLYAVDAATSKEIWNFEIGSRIYSSPAVADGTVFFGALDNNLYAVDTATGIDIWHFEIGGAIYSSPAVAEDTVFVGSNDWNLYAISGE